MSNNVTIELEKLDQDWVDLILSALDMGLSVEEIRTFLQEAQIPKNNIG
jgi:DNA-binding transcriptional MerR regulator